MKTSNNEIVWVFGSSAAGKETFIKHVTKQKPDYLLNLLGWERKSLIPCSESMEYIEQYDGDPLGEKREKLVKIVPELAKVPDSVVLVKGQDLDLSSNRLSRVKAVTPYTQHKIIFLHVPIDTLFERVQKKSWWDEQITKVNLESWLVSQIESIQKLQITR